MNKEKPKIFISYSWDDKAISRKLADCLRRDGAQVWIDYSENKAGDSFIRKMNEGLEWCDTFVLLWSESASNSTFVSMEWEGALAINLKIIPCLLDKTKLPIILSGRIYKDLSDFDEGYRSLAKDLNLIANNEKPIETKLFETSQTKVIPKTESIRPEKAIFRNKPKVLSENDVEKALKKLDLFDADYNKSGKGIKHQYESKNIEGDKVIIDKASGLMWQQGGSYEAIKFENANNWIKENNQKRFAAFNDWRLPTIEEALSLMEPEKNNNGHIDPSFNSKQEWIWTSDQIKGLSRAWVVNFRYGGCFWNYASKNIFLRVVRSA